jgi:tRNA threonylcarbamoyladenosine biosynthesis protein TsaB
MADTPLKLEAYVEAVLALAGEGDSFLFMGDGMPVHRERLTALLGERAVFAGPERAFLNPASVARLAAEAEKSAEVDYLALQPLYLRAPNAQRNRKLMEAVHAQ